MVVGDPSLYISATLVARILFSHSQHLRTSHFLKKLSKLPSPLPQPWLNPLVGRFLPTEGLHLMPLNTQLHLGLPPLKDGFQMKTEDLNSSHCGKTSPSSLRNSSSLNGLSIAISQFLIFLLNKGSNSSQRWMAPTTPIWYDRSISITNSEME